MKSVGVIRKLFQLGYQRTGRKFRQNSINLANLHPAPDDIIENSRLTTKHEAINANLSRPGQCANTTQTGDTIKIDATKDHSE